MKYRKISTTAVVLATSGVMLAPAAAFAADSTCPSGYSGHCTHVKGHKIVRPPEVQGERATLPFTGAEIVLMTVVGGGALGAGTAIVIAGRRRRTNPA
jgi:hypothetical protein